MVSSLFYLQSTYVHDEATIRILRESQDRVRSMALVHESLYRSEELLAVDFAEYAVALAQQLLGAYVLPGQNIRLLTSLQPMAMKLDQAVPCGLILNEMIANALKHAFPGGQDGEIHLSLRRSTDSTYLLTVRDHRTRPPPGFDLEKTSSLGFRLIRALARQIDGQLRLVSLETGAEGRLTLQTDDTNDGV